MKACYLLKRKKKYFQYNITDIISVLLVQFKLSTLDAFGYRNTG